MKNYDILMTRVNKSKTCENKDVKSLTLMVVTSHGSSPVVERHRRAAADQESRVYHPFAMPKRRLISRKNYRETYDTSNGTNRYTARYYVSLSHLPEIFCFVFANKLCDRTNIRHFATIWHYFLRGEKTDR